MKKNGDYFYNKAPNIYAFLVDNGVDVTIADQAQQLVSEFMSKQTDFFDIHEALKKNLPRVFKKLSRSFEKFDEEVALTLTFLEDVERGDL